MPAQHDARDRLLLDAMRGLGLRARRAEEELLLAHSPLIRARVERRLGRRHGDHIPEVHQAALERFRRKLHQEPAPQPPLLAFAYSSANYAVAEFFEQEAAQPPTVDWPEHLVDPGLLDPADAAEVRENLDVLVRWIADLDEPDRTIAARCLFDGERSAAVARDLGLSENAVNKRRVRLNSSILEVRVHA